jgi:hypothetical protein
MMRRRSRTCRLPWAGEVAHVARDGDVVARRRTYRWPAGCRIAAWSSASGRLALADALLAALTGAMLASGLYDWLAGHPTPDPVARAHRRGPGGVLLVHTLRRRARLRRSAVH